MRTKNKGQFLALALRIMDTRLTSGNRQDQYEAQSEIVASVLKCKVEVALAKVNRLKDALGKHSDGHFFISDPSADPIHATLKEVNDSVAALLTDAQTAYDATKADDAAAEVMQ